MAQAYTLPQAFQMVGVLSAAADAAGRVGLFCSMKNSHKAYLIVDVNQGGATPTTLSVLQATNIAGANSKALANACRLWVITDTSVANPVLVRQPDSATYTTDAGVKDKMIVFEVDGAMLDLANGYTAVTLQTGAGAAGTVTSVMYMGTARSAEDQAPSARLN